MDSGRTQPMTQCGTLLCTPYKTQPEMYDGVQDKVQGIGIYADFRIWQGLIVASLISLPIWGVIVWGLTVLLSRR